MAGDQVVTLRLVGEAGQLVATLKTSKAAVTELGPAASQAGEQTERGLSRGAEAAKRYGGAIQSARGMLRQLALGAAGAIGIAGLAATMSASVGVAKQYGSAMAEVSTLMSDTSGLEAQSAAVRQIARDYGQAPVGQAKALYQIISAGATSAAAANDTLRASNRLAIGGITDVTTAADGLTTSLNAYGPAAGTATDVSDRLFVAMKAGKTTIGELSASIGSVAPIAAQTGVSLDEVLAATAALTLGGVKTSTAMDGIRATIAAIIKPSKEAADLAESLGLQFDAAALKSQGLATFLDNVKKATGGSAEQMSLLFGGVEALAPVMALTGNQAGAFASTLDGMKNAAGQTDVAFEKMSKTAEFAFNRLKAEVGDRLLSIGTTMLDVVAPAALAVANNMDTITSTAQVAGGTLVLFAGVRGVAAAVTALQALRVELAATSLWTSWTGAAKVAASGADLFGARLLAFAGGPVVVAGTALGLLAFKVKETWDKIIAAEKRGQTSIALAQGSIGSGLADRRRPLAGIETDVERLAALMQRDSGREQALNRHRAALEQLELQYRRSGGTVAQWNELVSKSDAAAAAARASSTALGAGLSQLNDIGAAAGTVQARQAAEAAKLADQLRQLSAIEAKTPALAGEVQRMRTQLIATYAKEASSIGGLTTATKSGEKATRDALRADEQRADALGRLADMADRAREAADPMAEAAADYARAIRDVADAGADAIRRGADLEQVQRDVLAVIEDLNEAYGRKTAALARDNDESQRARDVVSTTLAGLEQEAQLIGLSARERTIQNLLLEAEANARRAVEQKLRTSIELTAEETAQIRARANAAIDSIDATDRAKRAQEDYEYTVIQGSQSIAQAWGDWVSRGFDDFKGFADSVKQTFKRMIADMLAQLAQSGIMQALGSLFGLGSSGSAFAGTGGGLNLGSFGGSSALPILGAIVGGAFGFGNRGTSNGSAGSLGAAGAYGYAGYALGTVGYGAALGASGAVAGGASAAAGAASGAIGAAGAIPVVGWIIAAIAAIDMITGGKVFGTRYKAESGTTSLNVGAAGGDATQTIREVRQRALFGGRQWRNRNVDASDEAIEAAQQLFDSVAGVMRDAATALNGEAPAVLDAALRTVVEYDKKGKVKATKFFVDILGRTWEEETAEAATQRIMAESMIATIDAILGTTVDAASQSAANASSEVINAAAEGASGTMGAIGDELVKSLGAGVQGEASAIAERWRDDAALLMDGAQMLLAAAVDIRKGNALLGESGTLTQIADLIGELQQPGEALAATYARVSASAALLDQALGLSGVTIDGTREQIVRLAVDIAAAAGGLDRAQQLWSAYFQTFYSESERLQYQIAQARQAAEQQFSAAGLNLDEFTGDGGAQAFRDLFESLLPSLSAEGIVQYLEMASALGLLIDLSAQAGDAIGGVSGSLADFMADIQSQLVEFAPEASFAERLAKITNNTDQLITRAELLGATEEQLAMIRDLGARQYGEVLAEQADAIGRYQDAVRGIRDELADASGATEFQRSLREIDRQLADNISSLNEAARAAGMQGAAEADLAAAHELASIRVAQAIARLEERGRSIVGQLFGSQLEQLNEQIALIESGVNSFAGGASSGFEQVTQAADNAAQAQISAQQRIRDWLDNLLLGELGGLRPRDALAEAQALFDRTLAAALGGDAEAMAALPGLADQLLRLGQQVYASGEPYFDLRDAIREALEQVASMAIEAGLPPDNGGGGNLGGGGAQSGTGGSGDLAALYAERERLQGEQAAAERRELALELAGIVRDLMSLPNASLTEIAARLEFSLTELVAALGVNLEDLTVSTASQLADVAQAMGANLTELAAAVGVDLGALADRQSLLNDALEAEIAGLPQGQRDLLEPLLRDVEEAAALGDTTGVERGIELMEDAINELSPDLRDMLAPYVAGVAPASAFTEIERLGNIDVTLGNSLAEHVYGNELLNSINDGINSLSSLQPGGGFPGTGGPIPPSYDVGTTYVPRDGLAMIHAGEAVVPASANAFLRQWLGVRPAPVIKPRPIGGGGAIDDRSVNDLIRTLNDLRAERQTLIETNRQLEGRMARIEEALRETNRERVLAMDRQTDAMKGRR